MPPINTRGELEIKGDRYRKKETERQFEKGKRGLFGGKEEKKKRQGDYKEENEQERLKEELVGVT